MEQNGKIKGAYRSSKNIYDAVLTRKGILSRLYNRIFWSGTDDTAIAQNMLSRIPDDFSGALLDVPVGTAVFTAEKWRRLKSARIVCLDYSEDMIEQAQKRFLDAPHISCVQGDVGVLPFVDESFDIVMSMNGFHAFPQKERAVSEMARVLKPGGLFIASFYIKGKSRATDALVRLALSPKGWFTPPFYTEAEARRLFEPHFKTLETEADGSIFQLAGKK